MIRLLLPLLLLAACQNGSQKKPAATPVLPTNLEPFADSLVRLNKYALPNIRQAADLYQRLVPADTTLADSAAVLLLQFVNTAVDSLNQRIFSDTTDYMDLVYETGRPVAASQKRFRQELEQAHVRLQGDGEGGVYAVPDHAWLNGVMAPKTSAATDRYLQLWARHETAPAMLDGGLAVEATELVDRLVATEELAAQKLPQRFAENNTRLNQFYTSALLFGSDNSPVYEEETLALSTPFEEGYRYLGTKYPRSRAAGLVAEWQAVLQRKDRKAVEAWRKRHFTFE